MREKRADSSSIVQVETEVIVRDLLSQQFRINLISTELRNGQVNIQLDIYSEEYKIIGEIYSRIGRAVSAQSNKIKGDILKMLLVEKINGINYRKLIVVNDDKLYNQLQGNSWLAEAVRQYEIETILVPLPEEKCKSIIEAQLRQNLINH